MKTDSRSRGIAVWFTGLSSSGKSTISRIVADQLLAGGHRVEILDGDVVRRHFSAGLGFSREDREENLRRIAYVAGLLVKHSVIVLVAAIAPYRETRDRIRRELRDYAEVYVNAPLEVCEARDVKGLYRRARSGEIGAFTGIDSPYEPPAEPDVECPTDRESPEQSAERVVEFLRARLHGAGESMPFMHS